MLRDIEISRHVLTKDEGKRRHFMKETFDTMY